MWWLGVAFVPLKGEGGVCCTKLLVNLVALLPFVNWLNRQQTLQECGGILFLVP